MVVVVVALLLLPGLLFWSYISVEARYLKRFFADNWSRFLKPHAFYIASLIVSKH